MESDVFILTRKLGHPELFFRESAKTLYFDSANIQERWTVHQEQLLNNKVPCYYSQKHSYV